MKVNETFYVAVDIGCLECGEDTHVLGIFTTHEKAMEVLTEHMKRHETCWHGQHDFRVFPIHGIDAVHRVDYGEPL